VFQTVEPFLSDFPFPSFDIAQSVRTPHEIPLIDRSKISDLDDILEDSVFKIISFNELT
jgi:hypothetical protein